MSLNMNPTIGTPLFQTSPAGSYTGSTGLSPQQLNTMVMGGTPSATLPASSSGFGNVIGGLGDIFGGLMGAGQSILSSPDALMGLGGGLLTKEAYDRLSDIGEQAKREAMGLAERGQMESEFRPFTVTTPTGAMFTARMGGQPARQPTMLDARPIEPTGVLPPGMDEREAFRQGLLGQPVGGLLPGSVIAPPQVGGPAPDTSGQDEILRRFQQELMASGYQPPERLTPITDMVEVPVGIDRGLTQLPFIDTMPVAPGPTEQEMRADRQRFLAMSPQQRQRFEESGGLSPLQQPVRPTADGLQIGMELSPEERALQQQLISGAGGFFGQAAQPTVDREQAIFERMRAAQRPEEERQRLALEERLAAQGRLGASSAAYGGATPELLALSAAEREARDRSMLTAMQQAQAEQAQQAALGGQFLGAGYLPQQQLIAATQPGLIQQELAQQAQQFGTGLFGETALSGIEAQLLQEQARANLLGGIGSNLITGLMNQQRAAAAQPSGGGSSGLGGLFGDIVDDLGTVGSGIRRLFNF